MDDRSLPKEFSLGPLQFTNADQFPLSEMYCNVQGNEIVLRLNAEFGLLSKWRGDSMVVFFMHRLPEGQEQFENEIAQYRKDEQADIKLPEKVPFDESSLALPDVPAGWEHDCFACGNRNLFHVYTSNQAGVMIRWMSKRGTMLDHPLLSLVQQNVRLVADQWVAEQPQTYETGEAPPEEVEQEETAELELTLDLREERTAIQEYIESRVAGFDAESNYGPGEGDLISAMTLGYDFAQGAWVAMIFDTREVSDQDGEWTTFLHEGSLLFREKWPFLCEALCEDQEVVVTKLDGTTQTFSGPDDADNVSNLLGELMLSLIREARTKGLLGTLPTAEKCYLSVEDFNGGWGWPEYEKRESDGRL